MAARSVTSTTDGRFAGIVDLNSHACELTGLLPLHASVINFDLHKDIGLFDFLVSGAGSAERGAIYNMKSLARLNKVYEKRKFQASTLTCTRCTWSSSSSSSSSSSARALPYLGRPSSS